MQSAKTIIKNVRKIDISTKRLVDGLISGSYHSIFKGQGIEFSEIREYKYGDDIRAIDWKVTARLNHPFIKEFIEERDLRVYFVFDYSASSNFGNLVKKRNKAIEITASLIFSAIKNNDDAGLFLFTDGVDKYIPARKGKKHALKLVSNLVSHKPKSKTTNINKSLAYVSKIIKKRSIIFVVSDFYDENFIKPLSILKNKHDVIALKINDDREHQIPNIGLIQLEDEETGEQILVDTSDKEFQENYKKIMHKQRLKLKKLFRKHKIDTIEITTNQSYETPLRKFFKTRIQRAIK